MVSAPKTPVTGLSLQAHSTGRFRLLGRGGWMPAEVWQYNTAPRIARISHLRLEANGV